jgi:VWFA-related protein
MRLSFSILLRSTLAACVVSLATGAGTLSAGAQLTGQNKPVGSADQAATIKVTSRLIIEAVGVKDKKGNPIEGLSAKDFTITEDGVVQTIKICEHNVLTEDATPLPVTPASEENVKIYNRLARTQIAPEAAGEIRYKDHRLLALYFDMTTMTNQADQMRALEAAQKFIRTQMTAADLVAILRYSGSSVDILQDFSADRNHLLSILQTMVVGEGQEGAEVANDDSSADTGAAFGQDDSEFNIFTTDRQLAALQTAAEALGRLNEKKSLIYFASGLNLNGLDNQAQLVATEQAAIRAGVSFWTIDARGLVASGPLGDATQGSQGGSAMYTGGAASAMSSRFARSQDTLYALALDTGGKALLDNNDLDRGIVNAQHAQSDYYILGYYTSNTAVNGKFRKVKVTLNSEMAANLDFRLGYFGEKEWGKFNTADKERQLEDALMQGDPFVELTVAVEINYFELNKAEYYVPLMVKVPGSELVLAKKRGADVAAIDFVGEIKDDYGSTTVTNIREHIDAKLSDKTAEELAKRPIEYSTGYTLLPGKYTIKVLARDDATGKIGTFQTTFVIPNLSKETKRVPISSVVLSSERSLMTDAIYNATKGKEQAKEVAADPLVQNGVKLIPSVTRVFSKGRSLYVYLQAYEPAAATAQPLIGYVSFYQGQTKVYETQPVEVSPSPSLKLETAPLNFTVDLSQLPPGKYDCQVTVLDPTGAKGAFWQAPILLVT